MAFAGSPGCRLRTGSAARVVFVGDHKKPNYVVESYKMPGPDFHLREGEMLLKMRVATICEEDLEVLDNNGPGTGNHPRVLGHEGVGEVVSWKPSMTSVTPADPYHPGERVVFSPWSGACADCPNCKERHFVRCPLSEKYGQHTLRDSENGPVIQGGTFASHLVLRKGTQVARLPQSIPDALAAPLACLLAPLIKLVPTVQALSHKKVAVVQGAGLRGAYACALLRESGFEQVFCHDSDPDALKFISRFGVIPVQDVSHSSTGSITPRVPRPGPCRADAVVRLVESTSLGPFSSALDLLKPEGTLVLVGGTGQVQQGVQWRGPAPDVYCNAIAQKEITVRGVCGYSPSDLETAVSFLDRTLSVYPYESLFTPLQSNLYEFPSALALAKSHKHCRVPVLTS